MRTAMARTVWLLHVGVMLLLLTAWCLPWRWAPWVAVTLAPMVHLNWWVFRDRCILTILEEKLRGAPAAAPVAAGGEAPARPAGPAVGDEPQEALGDTEEDLHFVSTFLSGLLGRPVSRAVADRISYGVVWTGFALGAGRLLLLDG